MCRKEYKNVHRVEHIDVFSDQNSVKATPF